MSQALVDAIARNLQASAQELAFLEKLAEPELEQLAQLIAKLEIHARSEQYSDTHWEDD
ncbi:hypothetical protein [Candidatus Igneacidithiobacillus taiwanensis]|uniref:hypothetical protein n=1 Tax=Candidatus Igneacidithiobacillus taiwanensis TaxID=1945924 RepID=UPI00289FA54C|nr:hypothetical protein [Candidatus Igneacidithiobacillus taiwanensis]